MVATADVDVASTAEAPAQHQHAAEPRFSLRQLPTLPAAVRESRHRLLIAVLALHVPAVLLIGVDRRDVATSALLALPVLAAVLGARFLGARSLRSGSVVLGLAWASYAVIHLASGDQSLLQPLFVVAVVALYQDLELLTTAFVAEVLVLAVPAAASPSLVFSGSDATHPWNAVLVHVLAELGVAVACSLAWRGDVPVPVFAAPATVSVGRDPEVALSRERARTAELTLARRQATYALMTNLARRNQSLIGRQLATLDDLERDERDPDVLAGLFALDHLATRMRRNAENLLVLAGAPAGNRGFAQPVPVGELLRGAVAEVEQYARVDVSVGAAGAVAGHAVSDVAHLLAELLDNALACSPPDSRVSVGSAPHQGGLRLWVADEGIGMTAARLVEHNTLLSDTRDDATEVGATLGFPVVRRLAARHGLHVTLGAREGGRNGLVAYVDLPAAVVDGAGVNPAGPGDLLPSPQTALPGRRAARRTPVASGRNRRNQLAVDAKSDADAFFVPAPLPDAEDDLDGDLWAEPPTVWSPPAFEPTSLETPVRAWAEPPPAADPAAPVLTAALSAWTAHDPPTATHDTVFPATGGTTLTRRVPQVALRESGGALPPAPAQVFEPGPELPRPAEAAPPEPARVRDLVQAYRAGLDRARLATAAVPSPAAATAAEMSPEMSQQTTMSMTRSMTRTTGENA
jgi:signal transduction histidine kinase